MTALSVFKTLGCLAKDRIKALAANVTRHRPYLRIFTPLCALHALITQHQNPGNISGQAVETTGCLGGKDYFFIGSDDGHTYPCGYRGREDLGPFPDMNLRGKGREPACRQCDWECFRDPSELFSPLLDTLHRQKISKVQIWDRVDSAARHPGAGVFPS